ncbi:hypothetical protein [Micromonospora inyonensis]|uniref:hypothetical protein n=1 Tax=Micromonospora inyonensis TaxID=47866 RepID=UPI00114CFEAD|nr:hypothetical protein [Micromonospora inyonensis]
MAAIGGCLLNASDSGEGGLGRAERQEHLWTEDTDPSSWSGVDPADPALLPAPTDAAPSETPEADGGTTPVGPIPTPTAAGAVPPTPRPTAPPILLDDFDGSSGWSDGHGRNDLGKTTECAGFARCAVTGGALVLRYEDNGWFGSYVDRSLTDYTYLVLRIRGERGGEESDIRLTLGGVGSRLTGLVLAGDNRTITTGYQDLRIPLAANRFDRATPGELQLDFWYDASSTVHIEEIRFE